MLDQINRLRDQMVTQLPSDDARGSHFTPKVAVIIPAYKHSVLLAEAIESALIQEAPFDIAVLIIDDGCPYPETGEIGRTYALAHANVFYLRKANGGLSSARNYGIEFALRNFDEIEAVYFLDADNRITPTALRDILAFMKADDKVDWIYPNIDKFGIEWNGNYTTQYSRLLHLTFDNICEAGSLVSRRLLDAGIRFDESMTSGFEDWDFWLQAIGRGFLGANYPFFGFEYRQRAESMLRDSNRTREGILTYIRQKHKKLFATETLLTWEHQEAPRYAAIGMGAYAVDMFTDPTVEHAKCSLEDFVTRFWAAKTEPETFGVPPFMLWMTAAHREALTRLGLIHNLLWLGERIAEKHHFVAIRFERNNARMGIDIRTIGDTEELNDKPFGWMCTFDIFSTCADDASDDWIRSLHKPVPSPRVVEIVVSGPFTAREMQSTALSSTNALLATLGALRDSGYRSKTRNRWLWRSVYFPNRSRYFELLRHAVGAKPVMPRLPQAANPLRVGFLLPIASFGGVEKVAYAVAQALKNAGCEVHLFLFGKAVYNRVPENDGLFKTVNFLSDDYPLWGGPNKFAGHDLMMGHDEAAKAEQVMGFLAGLDVVINNQVAPVNALLGDLRRRGVKVLNYVHVLDKSRMGRDAGHPYLTLAFEHVYDAILTCSNDMVEWLHGMGVPVAKLMHIQNAASYALAAKEREAMLTARRSKSQKEKLNVLFLGRLDAQKGIERLFSSVRDLRERGEPVDWKIIGSDVMDAGAGGSWKERFAEIGVQVEPPVFSSRHLNKAFAWADVVVLPSRWEGAPLTIIEAQRLGCVPIATAVGAVDELIDHAVDGLLIRSEDDTVITHELTEALSALAADPDALKRLSDAAAVRGGSLAWEESVIPLVKQLRSWFPDRLPQSDEPALKSAEQNAVPVSPSRVPRFEVETIDEDHEDHNEITEIRPLQIAAAGSANMNNLRN
ncbi:glycosyltransferase [Phyllobacterium sp. YR531]|uniref:glycosyltransferase n=1 Tax=Phyllobacterium sp. YR531 TaxID=1144343 RepID=UPI00026F6CD5|nr:glycosyltransferase [Phyllobacterium sp. YR531]EJN02793.1 glycosyltransferase [Phyllobacterium sp. YR531]